MRRSHLFLTALMTVSFAGMFGAADQAATLSDWVIPCLFGLCMGASLGLTLFSAKPRPCRLSENPPR
jgi:hypothetical protein